MHWTTDDTDRFNWGSFVEGTLMGLTIALIILEALGKL